MRYEFRLADIGEGLEEAEIVRWYVGIGDRVERDQPIIEVMTDKSNAELPAPETGTVVQVGGEVGDLVEVGELIAVIETEDVATASGTSPGTGADGAPPDVHATAFEKSVAEAVAEDVTESPPGESETSARNAAPTVASTGAAARPKASPSTRRIAAERGIDLRTVRGTGPGGRILLGDLDTATPPAAEQGSDTSPAEPAATTDPDPAASPVGAQPVPRPTEPEDMTEPESGTSGPEEQPDFVPEPGVVAPDLPAAPPTAGETSTSDPAPDRTIALRGVRRVVARNMAQSWSEIPHIHAFDEIDAEPLLALRERLRTTGKAAYDRVTPLTFFVATVARALHLHPEANSSIDMDAMTITRHGSVNVGVAVASDHGLVVPVVRNADRLDFTTLAEQLARLVQGARDGLLAAEHFRGGTVTVTNFGSLGGVQATPIIRSPEATIFGFGAVAERPFVVDGRVVARNTLPTVVGADHRLIDGDVATAVLRAVGEALLDPLQLVL